MAPTRLGLNPTSMDQLLLTATLSSTAAALLFWIHPDKGGLVSRMTRLSFAVALSLTGSVCGIVYLLGKLGAQAG